MSHYSISSVNHNNSTLHNYNTSSSWNSSNRSLFCKSQEELPMRPPSRTKSRDSFHRDSHFQSNACERPVRRPVRSPSDRSMLDGTMPEPSPELPPPASAAAARLAGTDSAYHSLLPALSFHDSTSNLSFRLIRSLSEQTLETAVLFQHRQADVNKDAIGYRYLKRTLSDSLLFSSQDISLVSDSINSSSVHLSSLGTLPRADDM